MNTLQKFRWASIGLVGLVAGGNLLPNGCVRKDIVVAAQPAPVEQVISSLQEQAERLNEINPSYKLDEKGLVALTRMLYFEDKHDRRLPTDVEQKKGYAAVAEVIKNRFLFDTCAENSQVKNPSCGSSDVFTHYDGEKGLAAVIEQYAVVHGRRVYQFTSQSDFAKHFTDASLAEGMYFTVEAEEKKQIDLAYSALVGVLDGRIAPLTEGALSYKNSDTTNQVWNGKQVFLLSSDTCTDLRIPLGPKGREAISKSEARCRIEQPYVHENTGQIGSHDFYTVAEGKRREVVWVDRDRNTYENGSCIRGPC